MCESGCQMISAAEESANRVLDNSDNALERARAWNTLCAAHELARHNIRVNSVHPGLIETAMLDQFPDNLQPSVESLVPMGRSAEPTEVAELVLWLASQESSYCTGAEFVVDGGLSAG